MPFRPRSIRPALFLTLAFALAASASACGSDSPDADDVGDAAPLVLTAAELHVLGRSDSLAVVEDMAVLDGTVWVQNSVEPIFLAFDEAGAVVAAHGRHGGGPAELRAPAGFVGGWEGEAWALDRRRHLLVRASSPGEPRAEVRLPVDGIPRGSVTGGLGYMSPVVRTARLGDEIVLPRRRSADDLPATRFWTSFFDAELVALDPATGRVRTVVSLPAVFGDLEAHFSASTAGGFPPFPFWYRLWAVCDDEIRVLDFVGNRLRRFAADGTDLGSVALPPPPFTEATPRQFVRAIFDLIAAERAGAATAGVGTMSAQDSARLIQGAAARIEGTPEQHAALLPTYVDFRCDDTGTVWLRPMDLEAGGMAGSDTWRRIDLGDRSDGVAGGHVREVTFPARFDPHVFTDGRAWGVVRDELDVAAVAWVEVP